MLNDIWQLTYIQTVNATRISNVFYYRQTTSDGVTDPREDLGVGFDQGPAQVYEAELAAGWIGLCYEIAKVGVTGQQFFRTLATTSPGAEAGEAYNAATAATIAFFTATGSHDGTGRTFIAGFPVTYENRNNLTGDGLLAIDLIGNALLLPITRLGVTFVPGRAPGFKKDPASTPEVPLPDIPTTFDPWILEDVRIPLTKIRSRRQSTRC
ncbi:unnamed protein product [marine sediment metagenome]|uniref:Uncharacterized protein n=1 Tax=marine sediment metagenome TaxID=412755 RepID=X0ZN29_9ZZZZ